MTKKEYEELIKKTDLADDEKELVKEYELTIKNTTNNTSVIDNNTNIDGNNPDVIAEILAQDADKLNEKIQKKEASAEYHTKKADELSKDDSKDSEDENKKSFLSTITGFLFFFGVIASVVYYFKNKPYPRAFGDSVNEVTEQRTEEQTLNKEPSTETNVFSDWK